MLSVSELLALLALVFLAVHLITDARRMVQVMKLHHSQWWEVATLVALVGHITFDYIG